MSKNAIHFISQFIDEKNTAVISAHVEHANYQRTNYTPNLSMGYYLKQFYGKDYCCISECVYEDSLKVANQGRLDSGRLPAPPQNSIEAVLHHTGKPLIYINSNDLSGLCKIRIQGMSTLPESEMDQFINMRTQLDGLLFVK